MRPVRISGAEAASLDLDARVLVLTHDVPGLRKGTRLWPEHADQLRGLGELHLVEMETGDRHEDEAGPQLGLAIAGPGIHFGPPVQSQIRLKATRRGLLRVRVEAVDRMNALGPVSVFTLVDGQAVEAGEEVAGTKVTPVAVPVSVLEQAEQIAAEAKPVLTVLPFRPLRTLVVATEKLKPRAREIFREAVERKLGWYGAESLGVLEVARNPEAVGSAYRHALDAGAELVLFAGASAIDPLDPAYLELGAAGGELLQQGAPMHPGSMLWLGRLGAAPVLGVASCAGFGRNTSLDLVLPFVFAYGEADPDHVRRLGHGGLIEHAAGRSFPPYS